MHLFEVGNRLLEDVPQNLHVDQLRRVRRVAPVLVIGQPFEAFADGIGNGQPVNDRVGQVVELVRQLRGEAGARQVEAARVALGHTVGRGANAGVVILTR